MFVRFCIDNGAMIAQAGWEMFRSGQVTELKDFLGHPEVCGAPPTHQSIDPRSSTEFNSGAENNQTYANSLTVTVYCRGVQRV